MSELCRICMFPKFDLINLVKDGTDTLERSGEKFEDCFGIKVKELPYCQRICKDCDKHLIDFYYFKQQALRTHNYLIDKACDLQARCVDIKEEIEINDVQIRDNTPDEFCNIEYLDEEAAHVAPLKFEKKENEDDVAAIKQEKHEIGSTEDTPSEVLDNYEQIESLMYETANESISEDRIESEGVADSTIDNGEEEKKPKENTLNQELKMSTERGGEFLARKILPKELQLLQQELISIQEHSLQENQISASLQTNKNSKKTSGERTRRWREKQKLLSGWQRKKPKTGAERVREYRERQRLLKEQQRSISLQEHLSQDNQISGSQTENKKRKTVTERVREHRERKKLLQLQLHQRSVSIQEHISQDNQISGSSKTEKKKRKTATERVREHRERKRLLKLQQQVHFSSGAEYVREYIEQKNIKNEPNTYM